MTPKQRSYKLSTILIRAAVVWVALTLGTWIVAADHIVERSLFQLIAIAMLVVALWAVE